MAIRGLDKALQYAQLPLQGATFGLSDELQGGVGAIRGYLDPMSQGSLNPLEAMKKGYATGAGTAREQMAAAHQATPKTAMALEIAGSLPTGMGLGKMAAGTLPKLAKDAAFIQRLARAMRVGSRGGSGSGAIYGGGAGEGGLMERLGGVGQYAGLAGGLGGVPLGRGGAAASLASGAARRVAAKEIGRGLTRGESLGYLGGQNNGTV